MLATCRVTVYDSSLTCSSHLVETTFPSSHQLSEKNRLQVGDGIPKAVCINFEVWANIEPVSSLTSSLSLAIKLYGSWVVQHISAGRQQQREAAAAEAAGAAAAGVDLLVHTPCRVWQERNIHTDNGLHSHAASREETTKAKNKAALPSLFVFVHLSPYISLHQLFGQ